MRTALCRNANNMCLVEVDALSTALCGSSHLWYLQKVKNDTMLSCLDLATNLLYEGEYGITHVVPLVHERRKICFAYDKHRSIGVVLSCTSNETKMRINDLHYGMHGYEQFASCILEAKTIAMSDDHHALLFNVETGEETRKIPVTEDNGRVTRLAFHPSYTDRIGIGNSRGKVGILDMASSSNTPVIEFQETNREPISDIEYNHHTIVLCNYHGGIEFNDDRKTSEPFAKFLPSVPIVSGYLPKVRGFESNQLVAVQGKRVYSFLDINDPKLPHFYTQLHKPLNNCHIAHDAVIVVTTAQTK